MQLKECKEMFTFFENMNKIYKSLAKVTKKKRVKGIMTP